MNKDHVKGAFKEGKGKLKEDFGHMAGKESTSLKGVAEQVAGKVQQKFGDIKDAVKEKVDHLLEKDSVKTKH